MDDNFLELSASRWKTVYHKGRQKSKLWELHTAHKTTMTSDEISATNLNGLQFWLVLPTSLMYTTPSN